MRRRLRQWWHAAVAAVAIMSPLAAAADQPVHDIQIAASQFSFEPATIQVMAGESVRLVSVEGTNNFRDQYSPAVAALVSRTIGEHAALYVEPMWVHHSNV